MRKLLLATVLAIGVPAVANAMPTIDDPLDPQLFVGSLGSTSAPGGTAKGGESNLLTGNASGASMTFGVAGDHDMQNPLLVIFAEPTGAMITLTSASCTGVGNSCAPATPGIYGLDLSTPTLSAGQETYQQLGLASGGSESYTNYALTSPLQTPPLPVPTTYNLIVFAIPDAITGSHTIDATEVGAPAGTYVSLYSCETRSPAGTPCDPNGAIGQTPFTNSGLIINGPPDPPTNAPEPASMLLLGSGLLSLGFLARRRGF
jgi:hypothetical protein